MFITYSIFLDGSKLEVVCVYIGCNA